MQVEGESEVEGESGVDLESEVDVESEAGLGDPPAQLVVVRLLDDRLTDQRGQLG